MSESNITIAVLDPYFSSRTKPLYQYDYGQILKFTGADLPDAYEVHFSNKGTKGSAKVVIGTADGVKIPDEFLLSGDYIYVWVFLHTGDSDGETEYKVTIPVNKRPKAEETEPTPVQQDVITQTIAALNQAVEQTAADVEATNEAMQSAVEAKDTAVASAAAAIEAETNAKQSEDNAKASEDAAKQSESNAIDYADNAKDSADAAKQSEVNAEASADRAEQIAATAGYMFVEMVDGHLIYTRTDKVDVDLSLDVDGHLIMEGVA